MIPPDDRGLTLGDGLFETLLAVDGDLVRLARHLDRLEAACVQLGLPAPERAEAEQRMREALADAGLEHGRAAVRLTFTAGSGGRGLERPADLRPRLFAAAAPAPKPPGPARLATSSVRRNDGSPVSRLKTLAYLDNVLARREAVRAGADEALMLNTRGEVACAAAANLFWVSEGGLRTPALACGVLAGVTRAAVIASARAEGVETLEVRATPADLAGAALFLTSSLVGVRPVASLDGVPCPASPLVERLASAVG